VERVRFRSFACVIIPLDKSCKTDIIVLVEE